MEYSLVVEASGIPGVQGQGSNYPGSEELVEALLSVLIAPIIVDVDLIGSKVSPALYFLDGFQCEIVSEEAGDIDGDH
jgi:hypothetical protein